MSEIKITEEDARVIEELIKLARNLKAGGYLTLINELTTNGDLLLEHIASEKAIIRGLALAEAAADPIKNMPPQQIPPIRKHITYMMGATFEALAKTDPKETPQVGMFGMLKYLNDPDVQKGLGFLMTLAKNLGKALKEYEPK